MTKVLFFLPNLHGGGAERALINVLVEWDSLSQYELEPVLVLRNVTGPYIEQLPRSVRVVSLGVERSGLFASMRTILKLVRILREETPAVVIPFLSAPSVVTSVCLSGLRTTICISVQNSLSKVLSDVQVIHPLKRWVTRRMLRWVFAQASCIFPIANGIGEELVQQFGAQRDKIETIPNSVSLETIKSRSAEPCSLLRRGDQPVLVAVGRLVYQKGFDILIYAFKEVYKEIPSQLLILGDGIERERLAQLIHKEGLDGAVTLLGFVDNPWKYIASADLFVLSSRYEGFGNVIIEALACGTPVVATRAPYGPEEILDSGGYGLLVEGNAHAIANGVQQLLADTDKRAEYRRRGLLRAEDFSTRKIAVRWAELCIDLGARSNAPLN